MPTLAFDPTLPLTRPAPRTAPWLGQCRSWGRAQLERLDASRRGRAGSYALAVDADALLADAQLLDELVRTGCTELLVDFVTLGPGADRGARGDLLAALVEHMLARGLSVHASFTLGFDHDDPGCFERLVDWAEARPFASVQLRLWTPDPGTSMVRRLAHGDRVRHQDFSHWDGAHVVIRPAQMDAQTLYRGWCWAQRRLSSLPSAWRRRPRRAAQLPAHLLRTLAPARAGRRLLRRLLSEIPAEGAI